MTFAETIYAILRSFWYNRDEAYMVRICELLETSLKDGRRSWTLGDDVANSDDMDIIWGTLVCGFGDYGTSPRFGWVHDIDIQPALKVIQEFKEDCERQCIEGSNL